MAVRKWFVAASLVIIASAAAPSKASADWLFTPFLGATFGGSADVGGSGTGFKNEFDRRLSWGASLGWMGGGAVGFEIDFGYSPNFFRPDPSGSKINFVGDGNITTAMANLVVGAPAGAVRPYASGGVGLIRPKVDSVSQFFTKPSNTDFGYDLGAGLMGFVSHSVGLRGDVRYFRSLQKNDSGTVDFSLGQLKYWRGTVGVTFKF